MFSYQPKLHHAIITFVFCIISIALCEKAKGKVLDALIISAWGFAAMTAVVIILLIAKASDEHWETLTEFAKAYSQLDEEGRAALGFQFPTMHYRMRRGEVRGEFEDTGVPIETFRLFLETSNDKYISPRRDWYTEKKPEWAWLEIKEWLEGERYIIEDSAAGSHSWLWRGESRQHLMAYWMAGRELRYANSGAKVYASETEGQELA